MAKGASVFAGRIGERVADPRITLVDDGTMAEEWGCFAIDDEGSAAARNVLIEDGILTDYMWDLLRSRKEGRPRSGNGRRQSYKHLPMVRMTNTYVLAGPDDPDDIVASTPTGRVRGPPRRRPGQHRHRRLRVRDDRGLPHRGRPASPSRSGRATSSATARRCWPRIDAVGQRLRDGQPRHVRQGRPGRPGRRRRARRCGCRRSPSAAPPDRGRARRPPSSSTLAGRIAEMAGPGEQVEAFVARSTTTTVRAYGGEVESLTQASSAGRRRAGDRRPPRGLRLRRHPRRGASCSTRWPRPGTTPRFGEPDEFNGLAEPDGVERRRARPVARGPGRRAHRRQGRAGPRARAGHHRAGDPRVTGRARRHVQRRPRRGGGGHQHRHPGVGPRRHLLPRRCRPWPSRTARPRSPAACPWGASSTDLDVEEAADDAVLRVHPPARLHQAAHAAGHARARAPHDGHHPRHRRRHAQRRAP